VDALGSGLAITNPTFTGTTRGEDTFSFTAELVEPDAAPPEQAHITALSGELNLQNGPTVSVRSEAGDLHVPTQRLDLAGTVVIETSDGYRMDADAVTLDLRAGTLTADGAVETTGPLGRIDSGSMRIGAADVDEARRFSFGKGVRLVYDPPATE
jgi:lipopolysaccharide export system protein LptC